jgi:hypothetical protein
MISYGMKLKCEGTSQVTDIETASIAAVEQGVV